MATFKSLLRAKRVIEKELPRAIETLENGAAIADDVRDAGESVKGVLLGLRDSLVARLPKKPSAPIVVRRAK